MSTESFASQRFTNVRREVFYNYPSGAATLTGLLSLLKEEETDDPKFSWWEKRFEEQWTFSAAHTGSLVFYRAVTGLTSTTYATGAGTWTSTNADLEFTAGAVYGLKLAAGAAETFRPGHVFQMDVAQGSTPVELQGIIVPNGVDGSGDRIAFTPIKTVGESSPISHTSAANVGARVFVIGSSFSEGSLDTSTSRNKIPTQIENHTQIFRTPFTMTGTALNTSVKYDDTGAYKDLAKENSVLHMIEMEKTFHFGEKSIRINTDGMPQTTTGGFLYFLRQWELGTAYGNASATTDTSDNKRIINNSGGTLSEKQYDGYMERLFRVTNNTVNEKLVLCGSGFLSVINQLYKSKTTYNSDLPSGDTYGMDVVKHVSPFGTVYYKTHPLYSQHPVLRYCALFVDVHNLVYRYMIGRDTELLTGREPNDADYRKDEWLTEAGLEVRYPESHMYMKNVLDFA